MLEFIKKAQEEETTRALITGRLIRRREKADPAFAEQVQAWRDLDLKKKGERKLFDLPDRSAANDRDSVNDAGAANDAEAEREEGRGLVSSVLGRR